MNTAPTQAPWVVKIPPPVWAFAMLIAAFVAERSFPPASIVYFRSPPLAVLLAGIGIGLAIWGERTFAAAGTEVLPASPVNKTLVTSGPFRVTRNPMYLGFILTVLGIGFYAGTLPFFAVPLLLFLLCNFVFIPFEEAKMQRQFCNQYTEYLGRVRRWI